MRHIARVLIGLAAVLILAWPVPAHSASGYALWNWYVIPAAAHVDGLQGTFWRTDISIVNPYSWRSVTVTVKLLKSDTDNTSGASRSYTLGPAQTLTLRDVVDQVFGFYGTGALVIWADQSVYFTATARTYTGAAGTFGQTENAQQYVGGNGGLGLIAGLRNDNQFRSNLGAVNASNVALTLTVGVYGTSGAFLGSKTITLQPWSHTQFGVGTFAGAFTEGYARWTCQATTSRVQWLAYGSVVDNVSGDAVFVEDRYDYSYTQFQPLNNFSGWWAGNFSGPLGSGTEYAWVTQTGAKFYAEVFNSLGFLDGTMWGYEDRGTVVITGGDVLYGPCLGDEVDHGSATYDGHGLSGNYTGYGSCLNGTTTFYITKQSGRPFSAHVAGADEQGNPMPINEPGAVRGTRGRMTLTSP